MTKWIYTFIVNLTRFFLCYLIGKNESNREVIHNFAAVLQKKRN